MRLAPPTQDSSLPVDNLPSGRTLASSKLDKGAGQNASSLSTNSVEIFKVRLSANRINSLFMGFVNGKGDFGSLRES